MLQTPSSALASAGLGGGTVRTGVLTPEYEAAYRERWRQQQEEGQVRYDRLTHCEPAGMPRSLEQGFTTNKEAEQKAGA